MFLIFEGFLAINSNGNYEGREMKCVKMLGLLIVVAAALMAFAGTASATTTTSPEGTTYTGNVHLTDTHVIWEGAFVAVTCEHSTIAGTVIAHGGGSEIIAVSSMTLTGCNYPVTIKNKGSLAINSSNAVTSTGAEVSIATSVGTCVFTTNGTTIGSITEGSNASLDVNSAKIPRTGGNFLCGSSGTWKGSYDFTTPNDLWVD